MDSGYCLYNSGRYGYMVTAYDISGCNNFEMTIHNSFNLEYPEYLREYADKEHIRYSLKWDINYLHSIKKQIEKERLTHNDKDS